MKKAILLAPVVGVVGLVIGLAAFKDATWSWDNATAEDTISYTLLIGQVDHNDSAARTKGIRDMLTTRVPVSQQKKNPNVEGSVEGKLTFTNPATGVKKTYKIKELDAKVQQSDAGVTWDSATATITSETWFAKYGNKLTAIISNNDGMAEGALSACNRVKGMPIFGYDSNDTTITKILQNKIMGTINSNAPAQAAAIYDITCKILDGIKAGSPTADIKNSLSQGIMTQKGIVPAEDGPYGKINYKFTFNTSPKAPQTVAENSILVDSIAVTEENAEQFNKKAAEQALTTIHPRQGRTDKYNIFQNFYSMTDTYLNTTMKPLFNVYRDNYGINDDTIIAGDGNSETEIINAIDSQTKKDAYVLNITKTTNAKEYLNHIFDKCGKKTETSKKTPIIFYNRQPTYENNEVDPEIMNDSRFDFIYYIGFDAQAGGQLQGEMVRDWLSMKAVGCKYTE